MRLAWPQRHGPAQSHRLGQSEHASLTPGAYYQRTGTTAPPMVRVHIRRVTCNADVTRRVALTAGALAAVTELAELGRLVVDAALSTWDWWYALELGAIMVGVATVSAMLYREWQRRW